MYCLVCPFSKTFDEVGVTYFVPDFLNSNLKIGQIVEIPFKKSIIYGIILKLNNNLNINFDKNKIKSIISIKNSDLFLQKYRQNLVSWISTHYITPIHNSLSLFLPKNLKEKIIKDKLKNYKSKKIVYNFDSDFKLSEKQNYCYKKILNSKNNKILFYGITGSGKTEIYIKLIKKYLDLNKQILFLIPEIILTNQLSNRIKKVFGNEVLIINSTVTDATKTKYWQQINSLDSKIIIGTRSALFYPYNNLGLIIIDEEHDNSYISDSAPRYNSIEVAEKITELNGNKLLLASGTPSIKSMYKGVKGEYELINLLEIYTKKEQ